MRTGLTLVEVIVALVVLEVAILGGLGVLALATRTMSLAEAFEIGVATAEGIADSLANGATAGGGSRPAGSGVVEWEVAGDGSYTVRYDAPVGPSVHVFGIVRMDATREP